MLLLCLYLVASTLSVLAMTRSYELQLTNEIVSPDGFNRSAVLANKQFPGTLITAQKNDKIEVHVVNDLTDDSMAQGTSIHWHGIFQHRTASQDGVAWVTQCPIASGDSFQYSFNIGNQAGTFWYHSHITTQYCDGIRGPLVIYDLEDPHRHLYDVDDERTVITLGDWYHSVSPDAFAHLVNPDSMVINGRGCYPGGPLTPLTVVDVTQGLRYRLRLVNTACAAAFNFSIDSHPFTVIEVDGSETYPLDVDVVSLWPGQRVSVILSADKNISNYWIRADPFLPGIDNVQETGKNDSPTYVDDPDTAQIGHRLMKEEELTSLGTTNLALSHPDKSLVLNLDFNFTSSKYTINGNTYIPPPLPVLLQILNGSIDTQSLVSSIGGVVVVPKDSLIRITIPGGSFAGPHPFHLHGHSFQVVCSAGSSNYSRNGPFRDVVNTGNSGDNVTFLFRTDNPGPWLLHCHIDFHLEASLAVVLAEAPEEQIIGKSAEEQPEDWKELCPKWDSSVTGKQFSISEPLAVTLQPGRK